MTQDNTLHIGMKIKMLRDSINMTQKHLAELIYVSQSVISKIENGSAICPPNTLNRIRATLDIKNAPLLESERIVFARRLQHWHDEINARRLLSARKMREEMAVILKLPFENDMAMRYLLFDAKLIIVEGSKPEEAIEILNKVEAAMPKLSIQNRYYLHYIKGLLCLYNHDNKLALDYFLTAEEHSISGTELSLHYNMAVCYARLGKPFYSIKLLEKAIVMVGIEKSQVLTEINMLLAVNYIHLKRYNKANSMLDECLLDAICINDPELLGKILHHIGCIFQHTNKHDIAIEYFIKAFKFYSESGWYYIENVYHIYYCQVMLSQFNQHEERHVKAYNLAAKSEAYELLFESLPHLANLKDIASCLYIESIIPRLMHMQRYYIALDYCRLLIRTYEDRKNHTGVYRIKAFSADIYEEMIYCGDNHVILPCQLMPLS